MKAAGLVWLLTLFVTAVQSRSAYPGMLDAHPAIDYRGAIPTDSVTTLRNDLSAGATLEFKGPEGYLRALLEKLHVPVESQVLVFSKTGIQHPFTTPENPRALYFNDRLVIGYIPGAPLIEMAAHDAKQGVIFQTLKQEPGTPLAFARSDRCLGCHVSANSLSVPGILVRSMSTASDGRPMPQDGSFVIDQRSPLEQRWAGWFVSGAAPAVKHLGRPVTSALDLSRYLRPTSDIAALLVFDHQGHAMNLLTRLGWESRAAAADGRLDFSTGDLADILNEAVDYFLFAEEAVLANPVATPSPFARVFVDAGPRDRHGRSLRELDLRTRLFKYRCSYMIYSPAFDALPAETRNAFYARLRARLKDADTIAILDDTKPGWRS